MALVYRSSRAHDYIFQGHGTPKERTQRILPLLVRNHRRGDPPSRNGRKVSSFPTSIEEAVKWAERLLNRAVNPQSAECIGMNAENIFLTFDCDDSKDGR
jgi:hypothetical protein